MRQARDLDLSSGMAAEQEHVLTARPDIPFWAENLLFVLYDPATDIGFWLHLGTVPTDWGLWEDRVFAYLPGDGGTLHMCAYHRTPPERRPAGANLSFQCLEPFKRWRVRFDGMALHTPYDAMRTGLARDGVKRKMVLDLDIACATPVWDAHTSASGDEGRGSMRAQGWATDHYQQLYTATGTVTLDDGSHRFNGTGWRDHSRGPRGGGTGTPWGGHAIINCLFADSGRGFGLARMWTPEGTISLDAGFMVTEDGTLHHAEVIEAPRLLDLQFAEEPVQIALRSEAGELRLSGQTVKTIWMTMGPGLPHGVDLSQNNGILAEAFARWDWDGEIGYGMCERSEHLKAPPRQLKPPRE